MLRAAPQAALPVIVLTAEGEVEDRVAGLDAGAVDYIVKPFSLAELLARVRAQLRVATRRSDTDLEADGSRSTADPQVQRAASGAALEHRVRAARYLLRHRGQVLSREQILRAVWGYEHDPGTNIVDVYVGYLRRKLRRPDAPRRSNGAHGRLSPRPPADACSARSPGCPTGCAGG